MVLKNLAKNSWLALFFSFFFVHQAYADGSFKKISNFLCDLLLRQRIGFDESGFSEAAPAVVTQENHGGKVTYAINGGDVMFQLKSAGIKPRKVSFRQLKYTPPASGLTAKDLADQLYGVKLKPLKSTDEFYLGQTIHPATVVSWIKNRYSNDNPFGQRSYIEIADEVIAGKTISFEIHGNLHELEIDHERRLLRDTHDVSGGLRRVYLHPTDPKKLIKVFDPSLSAGLNPGALIRIMQWELFVIDFFSPIIKDMEAEGRHPYFRMNPVDLDPAKIERGIFEVRRIDTAHPIGKYLNPRAIDETPPFILYFFDGVNLFEPYLWNLKNQRFNGKIVFVHNVPAQRDALRYIRRFHHMCLKGLILHGLDVGSCYSYGNVFVPYDEELIYDIGPVPIFIDF